MSNSSIIIIIIIVVAATACLRFILQVAENSVPV